MGVLGLPNKEDIDSPFSLIYDELNIEDYLVELEWDFTLNHVDGWNETLITKINEVSGHVHHTTLRGGVDTIYINEGILFVFQSLIGFKDMTLYGRYSIVIDNTLRPDTIICVQTPNPALEDAGLIEVVNKVTMDGDMMNEFTFEICKKDDIDDLKLKNLIKNTKGIIKIKNLSQWVY